MSHRPPSQEDRIQCSACGSWNDPKTRPSGGIFTHVTLTDPSSGVEYDGNGAQGCWFCGCPAWKSGGELGDMATVRYGSRAR